MSRVILLLLLWAGLFCPAAVALGAEVPPPSAPSPAVPSCFVLIQVAPDGELTITERLRGFGPSVDRPLSSKAKIYGSLAPFVQESDMEVVSAKVDGKPVTPRVDVGEEGEKLRVHLRAQDMSLPVHEYILTYKARDRILFLSDVDRLDWEIWGKRQDTGPLKLSCAIALPKGATVSKQWSRLGHETVGHKPVTQWINKNGMAFFRAEEPIVDTEHFVVSVEWNKGVVASDGSEEILSTIKISMWGLFALLLLLCGGIWFKFGKNPRPKVSIPLFYPPLGPDGKTLSPAAVAYIREAAMLTSRGFSALLLNLATQKMVDMTGTGSRTDPYVLQTSDEILKRVPADDAGSESKATGEESSQQKRRIWEDLLKAGRGFDLAERLCLRRLFPARPPQPLEVGRKSAWQVAEARSVAYVALASRYRGLWQLNGPLVSLMFTLCYGGAILVQFFLWLNFGAADMAAVLAVTCLTLGFTYVVHRWSQYGISIWVRWQEMGVINMILLGIYVLLWPVMLVYDAILDASMADFDQRHQGSVSHPPEDPGVPPDLLCRGRYGLRRQQVHGQRQSGLYGHAAFTHVLHAPHEAPRSQGRQDTGRDRRPGHVSGRRGSGAPQYLQPAGPDAGRVPPFHALRRGAGTGKGLGRPVRHLAGGPAVPWRFPACVGRIRTPHAGPVALYGR